MSFKKIFILIAFIAAIFMAFGFQNSSEHKVLFEKAKFTMETKGDLKGAIKLFSEIIKKYPDEREYAAKSQLYIGLCYEKLGLKEAKYAQKAFQKVLDNYPERQEEVALAKEKLASMVKVLKKAPHKPTFRKIRIPTKLTWHVHLSPDGQKVILASDKKLWIMPISGKLGPDFPGAPVKLNTDDVEVNRYGLAWSGDGKWIAFSDANLDEEQEGNMAVYIVSAQGGKPKKVHEIYPDVRVVNHRMSLSPYGKTLAFSSVEGNEQHIYTISVDGGLPKQLVDALAREPVFSPDGKMIAYVKDKNLGRGGGGLWIIPTHGGTPKLAAKAGMASSPIWSPGGDMIAFLDYKDYGYEAGQIQIVPIEEDGEAAGEMIAIDPPEGIRRVRLLAGWTPDNKIGAIFKSHLEFGLYTLPAKGGKAALVSHGGYPGQPRWSPDGKRIFHTNVADDGSGDWQELAIAFVSAKGGKVTTVPIQSDAKIYKPTSGGGNNVSPDGKMIIFSGWKQGGSGMHIWTLPVDGGKPKQLTKAPAPITDQFPCWSPDGKAIAFVRARKSKNYFLGYGETNIYIVQVNGGEPKPLTSESDMVSFGSIAWSPDGKLLAYFSRDEETSWDGTLNVIPVDGGEPRVLGKVQKIHGNKELAWSPDSKRIAFNGPEYYDKIIKVISLKDGSIVDIETDLVDTNIYHLDWSPDGNRLAFGGSQGGVPEFWLMEDFLPKEKTKKKSK